jgi:hypothetical protein
MITGTMPMPDYTITQSKYPVTDNLTTLQSYILAAETEHEDATGDFTWILSSISLAGRAIANKVRRARIVDVLGDMGDENVHGERQQKLDVIANNIIMQCLGERANVGVLASEEGETPLILRSRSDGGRYCIAFDPLDGSSNLDVSVGVGTIFSILRNDQEDVESAEHLLLQPGTRLPADSNQALGIAQYAIDFLGDGPRGQRGDPSEAVLTHTNRFMTDAAICGISALALGTNAPTVLRNEALDHPARTGRSGATVFGSERPRSAPRRPSSPTAPPSASGTPTAPTSATTPSAATPPASSATTTSTPSPLAAAQITGADGRTALKAWSATTRSAAASPRSSASRPTRSTTSSTAPSPPPRSSAR